MRNEPVLVICGAVVAAAQALIVLAATIWTVSGAQQAAIQGVVTTLVALAAAVVTRGRVTPVDQD